MNLYAVTNEINICQCKKLQIKVNGIVRNYLNWIGDKNNIIWEKLFCIVQKKSITKNYSAGFE